MHVDRRHLVHAQHRVGVEVALLDDALLDRDLAGQRCRERIADAAVHLHRDDVRIHREPAIDGTDHFGKFHSPVRAFELRDLGDDRVERLVQRQAPHFVLRTRLAPAGLLRNQIEHRAMARVLVTQQRFAKRVRILLRMTRDVVEEALGRERGVRRTHRAPPEHRHLGRRGVQLDREIRNLVRKIRSSFDRAAVDRSRTCKGSTGHDRLSDDAMLPDDDLAGLVEARLERVHI